MALEGSWDGELTLGWNVAEGGVEDAGDADPDGKVGLGTGRR